jgi:hypothetical protein
MEFLQDVQDSFNGLPHDVVLPVDTQKAIIDLLSTIPLPTVQHHRNPNFHDCYRSSSWNAQEGRFEAPQGGFGMPQSVNGSFYASHNDAEFRAALTALDQAAYSRPNHVHNCESGRELTPFSPISGALPMAVPKVMITDTEVIGPVNSTDPTLAITNLVPCEAKNEDLEGSLAAALRTSARDDWDDATNKTDEGVDEVLDEKAAVNTQAVERSSDTDSEVDHEEAKISITEDLEENAVPKDVQNTQDTFEDTAAISNNTSKNTTGISEPSKDVHRNIDVSQDIDSTYGNQPVFNTLNLSEPTLSECDPSELDEDNRIPRSPPRKKLTPKKPAAIRRSSRILQLRNKLQSQSQSRSSKQAPPVASPLRKRGRQPDTEIQGPERKQKRVKATRG